MVKSERCCKVFDTSTASGKLCPNRLHSSENRREGLEVERCHVPDRNTSRQDNTSFLCMYEHQVHRKHLLICSQSVCFQSQVATHLLTQGT